MYRGLSAGSLLPALRGLYAKIQPIFLLTQHGSFAPRRVAVLELLQKHVRQRDLAELLDRLVTLLLTGYTTDEQLISLLSYMLQVGETHCPAALLKQLAERVPHHEDKIMTIAERLKEESRAQGIAIGIEKGRQEGRQEGEHLAAIKIARTLLASGLDQATVMNATGLTADELAQIRH
ncbi:putative transposase [Klebsiella pneumoniae subsp. ozaenae]|uniref:Transposase n=2 Tax=Klebsiella pneumoniae TaxID=573 RepID=A0A377ZP21_KLEPN|nr:Rpn family recombination-promoting nuclease/putative transposase [Klebsiella pneumoniae]STU54313.1 putative transposase [Klebsiella pneumoniae subsp. ozaenae]STU22402.1 putative transposase [Klebsiella pneumoniae]STU78218.1 putative transposase [Klebsiella pneumoniae]STV64806.1 putative transposase [Klebsiella pneumoniae]